MHSIIKFIINDWDPIDVFPLFPEDEYDQEIDMIFNAINKLHTKEELGEDIYRIFKEQLGSGFSREKEECIEIANKILMKTSKQKG